MLTSREGGAFVLDDFLKYIVHNCFGVVGVGLLGHAQNVATLLDVILDVVVAALVSELSHLDLLSGELLVEVEEIQAGRRQLLQARREYRSLQGRHRRLELRRDQSERFVLDAKQLVKLQTLRDQVSVKFVEPLIEQSCEILGQLVRLLQTAAQAISQSRDVWHMVVLLKDVFLELVLESSLQVAFIIEHPAEDALLDLLVVLFFEKVIMNELHATHDEQLTALQTHVEGANRSVCGEADRSGTEQRARRLADIQS